MLPKQSTNDKKIEDFHSTVQPSVSNLIGCNGGVDSIETDQSAVKIGCTDPDISSGEMENPVITPSNVVYFSAAVSYE